MRSNPVARHPLVAFFVIAYAVAWSFWPFGSFGAFGPLVAALIVVPLSRGRAGLREWGSRLIRWRVRWVWYVVALGVPLTVHLTTAGLTLISGSRVASITATSLLTCRAGLRRSGWSTPRMARSVRSRAGEDSPSQGFRVAATPRCTAQPILAVLVAGWHIPLFFLEDGGLQPTVVVNALVTTVAVTFWYAWLFNRTGGSVLLVLIAHSIEGSVQAQGWIYTSAWCAVAIVLVVADRPAWRRPAAGALSAASEPNSRWEVSLMVRRFPLVAFFVLAYAFTWWVYPLLRFNPLIGLLGLFGPALAAIVVTAVTDGRTGVRALLGRAVAWRVPVPWYLSPSACPRCSPCWRPACRPGSARRCSRSGG